MSVQNGERLATKQDLADMYQGILPYLGGMPEVLANKFSKGDLYDTSEKMIGKWIDGKPIYQRVFTFSTPLIVSNSEWTLSSIDSSNIEIIINVFSNHSDGTIYLLQADPSRDSHTKVGLKSAIGTPSISKVCLQYTKNTDSANSFNIGEATDYSTDEKIVGTWIDGKPIFQRTFHYGAMQSGVNLVNIGAGIDKILNVEAFGFKDSNGTFWPLPYVAMSEISQQIELWCSKTDGNQYVKFRSQTDYSTGDFYFTVRYTKTTS